jgi:diguanylate cyclase (GGDEF)-like protein
VLAGNKPRLNMPRLQMPSPAAVKRIWHLVRPVVLAGIASVLLFASIDRSQPWSLASAILGLLLLGAVVTRQMGEILSLEDQLSHRVQQLSAVSEVVEALNGTGNVGGTLALALNRLGPALKADAGAIWLPATDGSGMTLVEHRNLPDRDREGELLMRVLKRVQGRKEVALRHEEEIPGRPPGFPPAGCLTVRMGTASDAGYMLLIKWNGGFDEMDSILVGAVGSDIGGALRSVRMISEARRLADRDPVTSLFNHRSAYRRLHQDLEKHRLGQKSLAVLMMDLDNFKLFNDTYGHPAGDEVLKRVAAILKKTCRESDIVARYGGDEFMVILPETGVRQAIRCAERIQGALAKERFRCEDSSPLPIGFSYGVAVYPDDATDVQELVTVADTHLYQSKTQGGNQITARGAKTMDKTLVYVKGFDLFRAMVQAIDNKDGYTRQHSEEVTEYSLEIARALELDESTMQTIQLAGMLHDVGKIGVPDGILRKPGKLTDEEFDQMRQHPVFGALIVGAMPGMDEVMLGVRYHHERWDGRGYPDRLAEKDIPLIGRIMAVADAFSAMTTSRPYRKGLTERQALIEVRKGLGTQFDPEIGELFIRLRERGLADKAVEKRRESKKRRSGDGIVAELEEDLVPAEA